MATTDPTATTLQSGAVISDMSKGGTGNVITPVDNSSLQNSTPITVPPTPTADPLAGLVNSTNADVLNAQNVDTNAQNQRSSDLTQYQNLSNQLLGKTADQVAAEQAQGIPQYNKQLLDLQNTARQQALEYNTTPYSLAGTGQGVTAPILRGQEAAKQRQLAISNMLTNSNIQAMQGNISLAQSLADKSIKAKYDPIEQQIQTQKDIIAAHYQDLTASQKKLADAKSVQLDLQTKQIANQKEDMKTIIGWGALAGKNGATPSQVQAIQNAPDLKTAANLFSPFSQDPYALQKAVLDLQQQRADIRYKIAQTADLGGGKVLSVTEAQALGVPYGTTAKQAQAQSMKDYNNQNQPVTAITPETSGSVLGASVTTGQAQPYNTAMSRLPVGQQAVVKGLLDYRLNLPSGMALKTPYWQKILETASATDPNFDAAQYNTRMAVRKSFTSGKDAQNINALNTAVGHIESLNSALDGLGNTPIQGINWAKNAIATATGSPKVTNFVTKATAVVNELATVFKGTGATDQEIKQWRDNLNPNMSPDQIKGFINSSIDLMGSRLQSLSSKYTEGVGKPLDYQMLSPKSQSILTNLGFDVSKIDPGFSSITTSSPDQSNLRTKYNY